MDAKRLMIAVPPNVKRLIPIIAEIAMRWLQNVLIMQPVPILQTVNPKSNPGAANRVTNSWEMAAFVQRAAITPLHQSLQTLIIQRQTVRLAASLKQLIPDGHAIPGIINPAVPVWNLLQEDLPAEVQAAAAAVLPAQAVWDAEPVTACNAVVLPEVTAAVPGSVPANVYVSVSCTHH